MDVLTVPPHKFLRLHRRRDFFGSIFVYLLSTHPRLIHCIRPCPLPDSLLVLLCRFSYLSMSTSLCKRVSFFYVYICTCTFSKANNLSLMYLCAYLHTYRCLSIHPPTHPSIHPSIVRQSQLAAEELADEELAEEEVPEEVPFGRFWVRCPWFRKQVAVDLSTSWLKSPH